MRIESAQRINNAGAVRRRGATGGGEGFSLSSAGGKPAAQGTAASASLAGIEALIMLQEVEDATVKRKRALKRGHELLDALESVKLDLIAGIENPVRLQRLADLARRQRDHVDDPVLADLLEHIELRAAVELAKRGIARP